MADELSPERSVRLLRAKAGELENYAAMVLDGQNVPRLSDGYLAADIALIASLLADHIERTGWAADVEVDPLVPIGDPLFNEDGTPWTAKP
jgi:hypothetical protein